MRLISPKQVHVKSNVSVRQQGRLIERGQFPKPIPLFEGGRRIAFIESEIDEWMAARVAAARGAGAAGKTETPAAAVNRADRDGNNGHGTQRTEPEPRHPRPQHQAQPPPRRRQTTSRAKTLT